jgi:hypothetical protein
MKGPLAAMVLGATGLGCQHVPGAGPPSDAQLRAVVQAYANQKLHVSDPFGDGAVSVVRTGDQLVVHIQWRLCDTCIGGDSADYIIDPKTHRVVDMIISQ